MTASYQFARHIQSYFLAYRGGILQDQPWRDFFNSIRVEPDKDDVVLAYELGVSRVSFSECYSTDVWVTGPELGVPYSNPTVDGWKNLIESGFPFLKRTIMTHPSTMAQAAEAEATPVQRDAVTAATTALAAAAGAWAVRVHEVPANRAAVRTASLWKEHQ